VLAAATVTNTSPQPDQRVCRPASTSSIGSNVIIERLKHLGLYSATSYLLAPYETGHCCARPSPRPARSELSTTSIADNLSRTLSCPKDGHLSDQLAEHGHACLLVGEPQVWLASGKREECRHFAVAGVLASDSAQDMYPCSGDIASVSVVPPGAGPRR
jgi:hypothetical protein